VDLEGKLLSIRSRVTQPEWANNYTDQVATVEFLAEWLDDIPKPLAVPLMQDVARGLGTTPERLRGILDLSSRRDRRRAVLAQHQARPTRIPEESIYPAEGWLGAYLEHTKANEVPFGWNFWCGLSILGAACRRNLYLDRELFYIYPNLYTILVGPSAAHKSTCIDLMMDVLRAGNEQLESHAMEKGDDVRVVLLPPKTTAEWIVDELRPKEFVDEQLELRHGWSTPVRHRDAVGLLNCGELSVLLGRDVNGADRLVAHLTEWYGCPDNWSAGTRNTGRRALVNVALTCVFGSTVEWIRSSVTEDLVTGGFFARCIFLYKERPSRYFPHPGPSDPVVRNELGKMLSVWSLLPPDSLPVLWGHGAKAWFTDWYLHNKTLSPPHPLMEPYLERKQNHLLKVAMLLSVSEHTHAYVTVDELLGLGGLPLDVAHLAKALQVLEVEEARMPECLAEIGKHEEAEEADYVRGRLRESPMTHTDLFRTTRWRVGSSKRFREIMDTLAQSGEVVSEPGPSGRALYRLTE
jgi:hypothetical protein